MRNVRGWSSNDTIVKERISKLTELNNRYQELNTALTEEVEHIKNKEKTMLMEEKRIR